MRFADIDGKIHDTFRLEYFKSNFAHWWKFIASKDLGISSDENHLVFPTYRMFYTVTNEKKWQYNKIKYEL